MGHNKALTANFQAAVVESIYEQSPNRIFFRRNRLSERQSHTEQGPYGAHGDRCMLVSPVVERGTMLKNPGR